MNNPFDGTELDPELELYPKQTKFSIVSEEHKKNYISYLGKGLDTPSNIFPCYPTGCSINSGLFGTLCCSGQASVWNRKRGPSAGYNFTRVAKSTETNTLSNTNSQNTTELCDVTKKGSMNK